jgi:hypothetical protein
MELLKEKIFSISKSVRYVAIYADDKLISSERPGIENTSSSESDKYEELIVNPTLLKLVTQRGNIDCGGAKYVIIKYGSFYEFVMPLKNGHLSVGVEVNSDLLNIVEAIQNLAN